MQTYKELITERFIAYRLKSASVKKNLYTLKRLPDLMVNRRFKTGFQPTTRNCTERWSCFAASTM